MAENHQIWQVWAQILHRWGLAPWVATLLEASGPLSILGSQAVYLIQPFLGSRMPADHLEALATMLNEPEQSRQFARLLREEAT